MGEGRTGFENTRRRPHGGSRALRCGAAGLCAAALLAAGAPARALDAEPVGTPPSAGVSAKDPLQLIISLRHQTVNVYRGATLLQSSRVATGKPGYDTPAGVYSILQKREWHRSNIYSRAPMPFMQRLTWSGIALHEGRVPNRPASHGCVRLPKGFAKRLFDITEVGVAVVIARDKVAPAEIVHEALFRPVEPPVALTGANTVAAPTTGPTSGVSTGMAAHAAHFMADLETDVERRLPYLSRSKVPLRILITRRTGRERMKDVQRLLAELGHDPGGVDGYMGRDTGAAILAFQRANGLKATGAFSDELVGQLHSAAGKDEVTGHIYVRQDFEDVFDAPLRLREPERPLGTHVYTAMHFEEGGPDVRWQSLTLEKGDEITAAEALDRVEIPDDIRKRLSWLLTPGSSLIVSDNGIGKETTKGTDFIVHLQ